MTAGTIQRYFAGLSRTTFLFAFASLFSDISTEMLYPVLPVFLTQTLARQRQHRRPGRRLCPGGAEYRAGIFRHAVGQTATAQADCACRLFPLGDQQAAHGTGDRLASGVRRAIAGPAGRGRALGAARRADRVVRRRSKPRPRLWAGRRRRQCRRVSRAAARAVPALRGPCRHPLGLLSGGHSRACWPSAWCCWSRSSAPPSPPKAKIDIGLRQFPSGVLEISPRDRAVRAGQFQQRVSDSADAGYRRLAGTDHPDLCRRSISSPR